MSKHGVVILVVCSVVLNKLQHVESIVVVHIGVYSCGGGGALGVSGG